MYLKTPIHTSYLIYEICLFQLEIVKFNTWLPLPLLYLQDVKTEQKFERKITFERAADTLLNSQLSEFVNNIAKLSSSGSHVLPAIAAQQSEIKFINKIKYSFRRALSPWQNLVSNENVF